MLEAVIESAFKKWTWSDRPLCSEQEKKQRMSEKKPSLNATELEGANPRFGRAPSLSKGGHEEGLFEGQKGGLDLRLGRS
ncbi:hypothetical protein HJFPF1_04546 [Paramyrothecium foliicola]|nr:hypothetical protein HJFPF1_04546 [Paramyrothecium foliicola]